MVWTTVDAGTGTSESTVSDASTGASGGSRDGDRGREDSLVIVTPTISVVVSTIAGKVTVNPGSVEMTVTVSVGEAIPTIGPAIGAPGSPPKLPKSVTISVLVSAAGRASAAFNEKLRK